MTDALPGAMPGNLPEDAPRPRDFSPLDLARQLLRTARAAALGTIDRNTGHPVTTLVNVATDSDGAPLILISGLSSHTANLRADARASVLLAVTGKGDPLAHPRLTVLGRFAPTADERVRRRFLSHHPKSALYADFPDFAFCRMAVVSAHLNGGFARAADMAGGDLLLDPAVATAMAEADVLDRLNADHGATIARIAAQAGGMKGKWRLSGIDAEGADLMAGDQSLRLVFDGPATGAAAILAALERVAAGAGSAP